MSINKNDLLYATDPNVENNHVLQINRLKPRTTVIPAQKSGVYYRNKEESSLLLSLNGDYKFLYRPYDDNPDFYTYKNDEDWDTLPVPSMWQFFGYGECTYPNIQYPIPFDPPFVKVDNPVGYYRKKFTLDKKPGKTILHFSGVDNAFYAYVNGALVGFSKGSRLSAEFDITNLIKEGENLLAVKVFTYSDATYLENQDMLMANGIFRDVYLICTEATTLWDYRVSTTYNSISVNAKFEVEKENCEVEFSLDSQKIRLPLCKNVCYTFELENPKLWNAEEPNLYDLSITLFDGEKMLETHSKKVGIMHTRVEGNKFLVNEKPIYIKGVNRHETCADNGRAITVEQIKHDLELIKSNNLNAIRLSHYTNNPATYEYASLLGLYLMDEADLETHGAWTAGDQGFLSKDPDWLDAYKDRVVRMLETNKNEPCIFIWSVGNECGTGENLYECVKICNEFDPTKPCTITQDKDGAHSAFRLIGYYPMSRIAEYPDDGRAPVIAIEYAHAMGNSSGTLKDYWDYNYTHEHFIGGFVWEFKSHGFYAKDENGKLYTKIGGDFVNNKYHWSNFCLDGYTMVDGTPKHTWYELGNVSFCAYVCYKNGKISIKNTNDFTTLSHLSARYEIVEDYTVINSGDMKIPNVLPHEWFEADIDTTIKNPQKGKDYYVNIRFYENDKEVCLKQVKLDISTQKEKFTPSPFSYCTSAKNKVLTVKGDNFTIKFDKGYICYYEKDGVVIIDKPLSLNLYRAPIDNDGITNFSIWALRHIQKWNESLIKYFKFHLADISISEKEDKFTLICNGKFEAETFYKGFVCSIVYEIFADGVIHVSVKAEPFGDLPSALPRFGFCIPMPHSYNNVTWFGRGKRESYLDSIANAPMGLYSAKIEDTYTVFDVPQESGNHENTQFVTLDNGKNSFSVSAQGNMSFSYHDFTLETLEKARHRNELIKDDNYNYLYIDYKMRGLGGKSCGPDPEEQYEFHPHSFLFSFVISAKDTEKAYELCRKDFGKQTKALSDTFTYVVPSQPRELVDCRIEEE
ncbi:MAG: DUF4981 domain-containing protein [Clostridiales bacterium]|nr:DUF4981 domain-containing protein [Clostridiales bacterium]